VEGATIAPREEAARIDMNEGRARVITDAASAEHKSSMVQHQGFNSWDAHVNRVSLQMLAVLRDTWRVGAKEFIAPGRAIPANDVDLRGRMSDSGSEIGKNVNVLTSLRVIKAEMMLLQGGRIGRVAGTSCEDEEYNRKHEYGDSLPAKPPNEKWSDEKEIGEESIVYRKNGERRNWRSGIVDSQKKGEKGNRLHETDDFRIHLHPQLSVALPNRHAFLGRRPGWRSSGTL
jgi:hypothetical protein